MAPPFLVTESQYELLVASPADSTAKFIIHWLAYDKANTLFAFLFGMGFWVQMQRLEAKGIDFSAIYRRRLTILLCFGLMHMFVLFPNDILTVYATAGFILFFLRERSPRFFLIAGLMLAVFGRPFIEYLFDAAGVTGPAAAISYSDTAILARQTASAPLELLRLQADHALYGWFATGFFVSWISYALGRFLLGAYVARKGWIQNSAELQPQFRTCLLVCLPIGLAGQFLSTSIALGIYGDLSSLTWLEKPVHFVSLLLMLAGYVSLIVVLFHSLARPLVMIFAPVGRMALTNYVAQSVIFGLIAYQAWPGFGLAGVAGPAEILSYAVPAFIFQIILSHLWLRVFAFGPLEWCWRALTYRTLPKFKK